MYHVLLLAGYAMTLAVLAQEPREPPIRHLGTMTAVSSEPLASVAAAIELPQGRVVVNDIIARRLLLFDSTLRLLRVVADSDGSAPNAYGASPAGLVAFHADSILFITPRTLSMTVLGPDATPGRTLALPGGQAGFAVIGSVMGMPGLDAHGRLVFYYPERRRRTQSPDGATTMESPDSSFVARFDFNSRAFDTAGFIHIGKSRMTQRQDDRGGYVIEQTEFPAGVVDDWCIMPDGSIAFLRGRDFHLERLDASGALTSYDRMPYGWERLTEEGRAALADSVARAAQAHLDSVTARVRQPNGPVIERRGANVPGGVQREETMTKVVVVPARPDEVPEYRPAFRQGSLRADADTNLWIRTNKSIDGAPVYDVASRTGRLLDRLVLPRYRIIAGFGAGVIYTAVRDSSGVIHLERSRIR